MKEYFKAYLESFYCILGIASVAYMAKLTLFGEAVLPVYLFYIAALASVAGPIKLLISR